MTTATLTAEPIPALHPGAVRYVVDCEHGTTTAIMTPGHTPMPAAVFVRIALARHYDEERCGCTVALRRKYGVAA
jgi:hypothetical protein